MQRQVGKQYVASMVSVTPRLVFENTITYCYTMYLASAMEPIVRQDFY